MTPDIIAEEKEDALKLPVALEHGFMQDEEDQDSDIPYSVFTKNQNRCLVAIVAFASMFSPLSSFVYYPAIQSLARDLHSSVELINLTVTSYMIVSGVTPAIVGDLADFAGRRPVYLSVFVVYSAANLGLALQRSYPALLVLRMLQSAGGSGTLSSAKIATSYGKATELFQAQYHWLMVWWQILLLPQNVDLTSGLFFVGKCLASISLPELR
ncbi:hypothetical protein MMC20_007231 [Loxospora ochrophaea]|nr:hypothetical protein [Loxospora ochrophaea]